MRGNGAKRKASILKYESVPENKTKKCLANRRRTLAKYGWTEVDFQREIQRQNYKCYGCMEPITDDTARIDHNHETNKVRGLLCDSCNWTVGHSDESPSTLRRLMAYLERDREKRLVYLGGSLRNPRIPEIGNELRARGYDVMDEWFTPGPEADTNWQAYERLRGRSYTDALKGRAATNVFLFDKAYIDLCDLFVLVMPAGKSAMLELGYVSGLNKPAFIFLDGEDPDRYDVMPQIATAVCADIDALVKQMEAVL